MAARNRGAAVLLVSEDLDELLELADRIVVDVRRPFRLHEARASEADPLEIGRHMAGHERHGGGVTRREQKQLNPHIAASRGAIGVGIQSAARPDRPKSPAPRCRPEGR